MLGRIKRLWKHRWLDDSVLQRAVPADMLRRLGERVAASERRHSGEIRIFVEAGLPLHCLWTDAPTRHVSRQRALDVFSELRVWDTAHNNGVLIYLLLAERSIEVVADRGLSERVPLETWQAMVARMRSAFQQGQYEEGLTQALGEVSALLVEHFSLGDGDDNPNELPDAPVLN